MRVIFSNRLCQLMCNLIRMNMIVINRCSENIFQNLFEKHLRPITILKKVSSSGVFVRAF